jgi:pyrroloquinoline quinone biosynthesis protein D
MNGFDEIADAARPHLPRGVRLRFDAIRKEWNLLAPERVLKIDSIAVEILKRCSGEACLTDIVADLAQNFAADPVLIRKDVSAFLHGLVQKRMIDL